MVGQALLCHGLLSRFLLRSLFYIDLAEVKFVEYFISKRGDKC